MKTKFAKLFGDDSNQVLVKKDMNDDGVPEIRFYFQPHEDLGVCSYAIAFKDDSDESWDKCEKAFDAVSEDGARKSVATVIEQMKLDQP